MDPKKELEKLNCLAFERTGVCIKGDHCNKIHRNTGFSRCLVFHHIYPDPDLFIKMLPDGVLEISDTQKQNILDAFYLDMYIGLNRFGILDDMLIAGNQTDCQSGNVIALFHEIDSAYSAYMTLNNQFYAGRRVSITFAPILRLTMCICKEENSCPMGHMCSFIHPIQVSEHIYRECFPRNIRSYAEPWRIAHRFTNYDSPNDVLYGKSKMLKKNEF